MESPIRKLHNHEIPEVDINVEECGEHPGTTIVITGYNNNRMGEFTHDCLKDYIMWFTKMGSVEKEFGIETNSDVQLILKGVDRDEPETIKFGHFFPQESRSVTQLFDKYLTEAPKWYCKKIVRTGNLNNNPFIKYEAIFVIEGTRVKYDYNKMIKRSGYSAPKGAYTVQERYGLWVCKDFIPIQRKNEWITQKGSEYTRFHAFFNCQGFRLTANRGSVDNTHSEIMNDIKQEIKNIFEEILQSDDWRNIDWLENEATSTNSINREAKDFKWRIDRAQRARVADYKGIRLIEPSQENGVFSIFMQLKALDDKIFPFTVIDYDTHVGIDVIVKENNNLPIKDNKLYYVEFKYFLKKEFNHSFKNLYGIICWDIDTQELKHGDEVVDIGQNSRIFKIVAPEREGDRTRFFLDNIRDSRKIEIFVLKRYLEEVAGITFRARTDQDIL